MNSGAFPCSTGGVLCRCVPETAAVEAQRSTDITIATAVHHQSVIK